MSSFMAEKATGPAGQQRYNREGLYAWARARLADHTQHLTEEQFRTESRANLRALLMKISAEAYPTTDQAEIDARIEEAMSGTKAAEADDAKELTDWMKQTFQIEIDPAKLTGKPVETVRKVLWNAFDDRYRPEMHRMERNLLLDLLDTTWKNHLLTMDHLRSRRRPAGVRPGGPEDGVQEGGDAGVRPDVGEPERPGDRHGVPGRGRPRGGDAGGPVGRGGGVAGPGGVDDPAGPQRAGQRHPGQRDDERGDRDEGRADPATWARRSAGTTRARAGAGRSTRTAT